MNDKKPLLHFTKDALMARIMELSKVTGNYNFTVVASDLLPPHPLYGLHDSKLTITAEGISGEKEFCYTRIKLDEFVPTFGRVLYAAPGTITREVFRQMLLTQTRIDCDEPNFTFNDLESLEVSEVGTMYVELGVAAGSLYFDDYASGTFKLVVEENKILDEMMANVDGVGLPTFYRPIDGPNDQLVDGRYYSVDFSDITAATWSEIKANGNNLTTAHADIFKGIIREQCAGDIHTDIDWTAVVMSDYDSPTNTSSSHNSKFTHYAKLNFGDNTCLIYYNKAV